MVPYSQHAFGPGVARPITVLGETSASFFSAALPTPVCNEQGQVLGTFVPAPAKIPNWVTPELLAECDKEQGGRTLSEIMNDLTATHGT
jgi:hypothetical protein